MYHNLLVPLDGSWFAEAALPMAARIAKAAGGKLNLVMVHQPVAAQLGMGDLVMATPEFELEMLSQDQAYLADTAAGLTTLRGVPVEYREADGIAGPEICEEATRTGADLVVISTHGRGGFRRFWLGGVADYVVRHMTVPVLLIHPDRTVVTKEPAPVRRILVALDLSKESEAILDPAIAMARVTGSALTLAHVCEVVPEAAYPGLPGMVMPATEVLEFSRTTAKERLDVVAEPSRRLGLSAETKVLIGTGAAAGLLELLESDRYDMIAMTTHGRGGMGRLVLGSVADKVIRGTLKPVLVLRPGGPPA